MAEQKGQRVQELNVGKLKKNKFDLKSEIEKSVNYNNETTMLLHNEDGGSLVFDQDLEQELDNRMLKMGK